MQKGKGNGSSTQVLRMLNIGLSRVLQILKALENFDLILLQMLQILEQMKKRNFNFVS